MSDIIRSLLPPELQWLTGFIGLFSILAVILPTFGWLIIISRHLQEQSPRVRNFYIYSVVSIIVGAIIISIFIYDDAKMERSYPIHVNKWEVFGNFEKKAIQWDRYIVPEVELTSTAVYVGEGWLWTDDTNGAISFEWPYPGYIQEIKHILMKGIRTSIYIDPEEGFQNRHVFCRYYLEYDFGTPIGEQLFFSSDQFIPYNNWSVLVWDFTGTVWPDESMELFSLVNEEYQETGISYFDKWTGGYSRIVRPWSFSWQWEYLPDEYFNPDSIEAIGVKCSVSAVSYPESKEGDVVEFRGDFRFGNITVYP